MNFDTIITALIAVISLLLGCIVLANDYKNISNRLFFAFNFSASVWISSSLVAKFLTIDTVQPFVNIGFAATSLVVYFFLMFSIAFPNSPNVYKSWWHILSVMPLIFIILSFMNLVAKATPDEGVNFKVSPGFFYIPYFLFLLSYAVASIIKLFVNYRQEKGIRKEQIFVVLLGFSIYAFLALFFSLVMPVITHNPNIYKWGIYSVIIFLVFTTYAIIERGLLNVKVIVTELAVLLVILALLVQTLSSENLGRGIINASILIIVAYGGYLIIASVKKEIAHNRQLQNLTHQLEQDKRELVDLDRMKDEFLQMATHELNTPITVIQGRLSMAIEENMCHLNDEQKKFLQPILTDTKRLAQLSKDILNVARIDQHRMKINVTEADIDSLISSIVSGFELKAKEKGNSIAYIRLNQSLPKIMIDQSKITEVLTNLISNANKFTENGKIAVTAKAKDDDMIITIGDSGVGIEKEEQKHLFEKFFQAGRFDPDNPQEQQGTGLGLFISKNIIELHGGKIQFDSAKGKGSTFYFSLPLKYKEIGISA